MDNEEFFAQFCDVDTVSWIKLVRKQFSVSCFVQIVLLLALEYTFTQPIIHFFLYFYQHLFEIILTCVHARIITTNFVGYAIKESIFVQFAVIVSAHFTKPVLTTLPIGSFAPCVQSWMKWKKIKRKGMVRPNAQA